MTDEKLKDKIASFQKKYNIQKRYAMYLVYKDIHPANNHKGYWLFIDEMKQLFFQNFPLLQIFDEQFIYSSIQDKFDEFIFSRVKLQISHREFENELEKPY